MPTALSPLRWLAGDPKSSDMVIMVRDTIIANRYTYDQFVERSRNQTTVQRLRTTENGYVIVTFNEDAVGPVGFGFESCLVRVYAPDRPESWGSRRAIFEGRWNGFEVISSL